MSKVLHITTAHPADDVRILYKECTHLAKSGLSVVLAAPGPEQDLGLVTHIPLGRPGGRLNRIKLLWKAWMTLRREAPAICHIHDPELLLLGWVHAVTGGAVVYDAHEFYVEAIKEKNWIPKWMRGLIAATFDVAERIAARRIHQVVTADPGQNGRYEQLGCQVITMANLPVAANYVDPVNAVTRTVVHVGALSTARGLHVILDAARRLQPSGVKFLLVGELKQSVPLPNNVFVTGRVPPHEVSGLLRQGGIGLSGLLRTDQYERLSGAPTKVFEYLAAGLPVVLSDLKSHQQIVAKSGCGVVYKADDPEACAKAIMSLLDDPEHAQTCGLRARSFFLEVGSWESQMPRLLALYSQVQAERKRK